jgi:hypothetical protein
MPTKTNMIDKRIDFRSRPMGGTSHSILSRMSNVGFAVAVFTGFFLAMLVCLEAGRRLGRRDFAADHRPAGLVAVETVAFGLLGLLLALTFSGAAERLDRRRAQIVEEANDIGTAWLRLDVLPAAAQPKLRETFRRYTDSRILTYRTVPGSGLEPARAELARSATLQQEIWADAIAASRDVPQAAVVLLPALNSMFDITTTRLAATQMHPPPVVYIVLGMLSLACGFLVGYEMGASEVPSWPHIIVLALLLSVTLYVILDFEYPRLGLIRIDDFDQLLVQVRASMG